MINSKNKALSHYSYSSATAVNNLKRPRFKWVQSYGVKNKMIGFQISAKKWKASAKPDTTSQSKELKDLSSLEWQIFGQFTGI